jgi:hypothetical protein
MVNVAGCNGKTDEQAEGKPAAKANALFDPINWRHSHTSNYKISRRVYEVGWITSCTPGMGVNLWGVSPLYENQGCPYLDATKSTSRRQGRIREDGSGGSPRHTCGPTNRNRMIRLSLRASWHDTTKPTGSGGRVNAAVVLGTVHVLIRGDLPAMRQGWCERNHGHL